jgi:hypothetical protein
VRFQATMTLRSRLATQSYRFLPRRATQPIVKCGKGEGKKKSRGLLKMDTASLATYLDATPELRRRNRSRVE